MTESNNNKARKIVISTGVVTTLAGSGTAAETDDTGTAAAFNSPMGITIDGTYLYVADCWGETIRKVVIATGAVSTLAGNNTDDSIDARGRKPPSTTR